MSKLLCVIYSVRLDLVVRFKNLIRGMDTYSFPDWNTEFPLPDQRKPFVFGSSENELVELLWQDGEVVLNTQTNNRKPIQDYESISWADCPIDEAFEKEFCANLLSETPNPVRPDSGDSQPPAKRRAAVIERAECSVRTVNSSHCASNQVANRDVDLKYGRNVSPSYRGFTDKETGGSGSSEFWNQSNETNSRKRKTRDGEESECRSDATKLESAAENKSTSQKHGMSRKSRVAEVHNMSERRRRDRINERMRALQELIPHSNKSDKASMLDEAIEYMKSLQWQLQMMWMGSGMAPMMMPRFGMGMGPPMMPAVQSLMGLSRLPLVDQAPRANQALVNYHNQMQNYMGFLHSPINAFNYGFHSAQQNMTLTPPDNSNRPHAR